MNISSYRFGPALLLGGAGLLYSCTMPLRHTLGDPRDELREALAAAPNIRPHHLLTSVLNGCFADLTTPLLRPEISLQLLMILCALIAASGMFRIALHLTKSLRIGLGIMALFLVANGVWIHATTVETGMVPLTLTIGAMWLLVGRGPSLRRTLLAFSLLSASVLFALYHALLCLPVLIYALSITSKDRRLRTAASACVPMALVAALYVGLPLLAGDVDSLGGFLTWLTHHPNQSSLAHLHVGVENGARAISGLLSLIVNTAGGTTIVKQALRGEGMVGAYPEELLRLAIGCLALAGLLILAVRGSVSRSPERIRSPLAPDTTIRNRRYLVRLCWGSGAFTWLFGLFWLGSDPQFWLPWFPFLLILVAFGLRRYGAMADRRVGRIVSVAFSVLLLVLNIPIEAPSILFPNGGVNYQYAMKAVPELDSGATIITAGGAWAGYVGLMRDDVTILDLTLESPSGETASTTDYVQEMIDQTLGHGSAVYFEQALNNMGPYDIGRWEVVRSLHGVGRAELLRSLEKKFRLLPVTEFEGIGLAEIRRDGMADLQILGLKTIQSAEEQGQSWSEEDRVGIGTE